MLKYSEVVTDIFKHNKGTCLELLLDNSSKDGTLLINVDPLKCKWCDEVVPKMLVNPRIDFSAAIRYACSMWTHGYRVDSFITCNVQTDEESRKHLSVLNMCVLYGIDGATRILAIRMCNVLNHYLSGGFKRLPEYSMWGEGSKLQTTMVDIFHKLTSTNEVVRTQFIKYSEKSPLENLKKIPARVHVNRDVEETSRKIVELNTATPFTDMALAFYARHLLQKMVMSIGNVTKILEEANDGYALVCVAAMPDYLFDKLVHREENLSDAVKRLGGFLMTVRLTLNLYPNRVHLQNITQLADNSGIIAVDEYVKSFTRVNPLTGKLVLTLEASAPGLVTSKNPLVITTRPAPTKSIEQRLLISPPRNPSVKTLSSKQRVSAVCATMSSDLTRIEGSRFIVCLDNEYEEIMSEALMNGETPRIRITHQLLDKTIAGKDTVLQFSESSVENMKVARTAKTLITSLSVLYFTSTKVMVNTNLESLGGGLANYYLPYPSLKWRLKTSSEGESLNDVGLKVLSQGDVWAM